MNINLKWSKYRTFSATNYYSINIEFEYELNDIVNLLYCNS